MRRGRSMVSLAILALASSGLVAAGHDAIGVEPPSVRLFAASSRVDVQRNHRGFARVDPGMWVAPMGGALELRVSRPDYDTPISIVQTDATTGAALRTLPADLLDGWLGL